jgi:hypothetical protein
MQTGILAGAVRQGGEGGRDSRAKGFGEMNSSMSRHRMSFSGDKTAKLIVSVIR